MMREKLTKLTIRGFKSINEATLEFKPLNVLIGGNGAGKSNLLSLFYLLYEMMNKDNLKGYLFENGGISDFLFNGRKVTPQIEISLMFEERGYRFKLKPTVKDEDCILCDEARYCQQGQTACNEPGWWELGDSNNGTAKLVAEAKSNALDINHYCSQLLYQTITAWRFYHFQDTGKNGGMRHAASVNDDLFLRSDAANLAPYLRRLRDEYPTTYHEIVQAIRLALPFFADFILTPKKFGDQEKVSLEWTQKNSDYPLQPHQFSDGSLRFIGLATALLQPEPPPLIIIDEPELGLHPTAIALLAELINSAAKNTQLIIATQSPTLIDYFAVEDIVVIKRRNGSSTFERLCDNDFRVWLENYSIGELWRKNVIAGGADYE